jgi:hypothetical protein
LRGKRAEKPTGWRSPADIINEIMGTPEKGIPHDLLNKAVCVGITPQEMAAAPRPGKARNQAS